MDRPEDERLVDATLHRSGEWTAVGVDADFGLFLVRGDAGGEIDRIVVDDPELAGDERVWLGEPPDALRVHPYSEASASIEADGEDAIVALQNDHFAVLAYRWSGEDGAFVRGPRALVSPSVPISPYLPIGGSYDDFDAVVVPHLRQLGAREGGRAFVAVMLDRTRLDRHDALLGTDLDLLRDRLHPREQTIDVLVVGSAEPKDGRRTHRGAACSRPGIRSSCASTDRARAEWSASTISCRRRVARPSCARSRGGAIVCCSEGTSTARSPTPAIRIDRSSARTRTGSSARCPDRTGFRGREHRRYRPRMDRRWLLIGVLATACGGGEVTGDAGQADAAMDSGVDAGIAPEDSGLDASDDAAIDDAAIDDAAIDDAAIDDAAIDDAATPDAGPCVLDRAEISGNATTYPISAFTTCGSGIEPWMSARMAVSTSTYGSGAACGACARVTGPTGSALVLMDDLCPECAANDVDLDPGTFAAITGATDGRIAITWQRVPCEPPGDIQIDFQGSHAYYVKLRLTQQRTPIARVEIQRPSGAFADATRTIDGFFELSPGEALSSPITIRATDTFGSVVTFSTPINMTNGVLADTGQQLPIACAP